jgi:hypothetical protein
MYNYTIEIQAWERLIGSGTPEIKKIQYTSETQLWGEDLKPIAIRQTLSDYAGTEVKESYAWTEYARETLGLSWKAGSAQYEGEAQIFNMVIGETHNPSVGEFYTVYTYTTPKETTQ